jgi:predicted dehydrogenase
MQNGTPPNVAVWGCGWFAVNAHIPALVKLDAAGRVRFYAVCSRSINSIKKALEAANNQNIKSYLDQDEFLSDPTIDLIILTLPITEMGDAIRKALKAGKNVISEKPCAPSVAECLNLIDFQQKMNPSRFWAVAENYRFKASVQKIVSLIQDGSIGTLHSADFKFTFPLGPEPNSWRQNAKFNGGYLLDFGVHFVALLREIIGEVVEIFANVSQNKSYTREGDTLEAILKFENGVSGTFKLSFSGRYPNLEFPELCIEGSHGTIQANFRAGLVELLSGGVKIPLTFPEDVWTFGGVLETLEHCIDALAGQTQLRSTPLQGLRDVSVIEAAFCSNRLRSPINPESYFNLPKLSPKTASTFERTLSFNPSQAIWCRTVPDVQETVSRANKAGISVRPFGAGASWAVPIITTDLSLRTARLKPSADFDKERNRIRVSGGMPLGEVTRCLSAHNLCLPSLTFRPQSTIAGCVSTASHGTSMKWGTLSDFATQISMVLASGEIVTFNDDINLQHMRAARASLGLLGVIVELELQAVQIPWFKIFRSEWPLEEFIRLQENMWDHFDHIWCKWNMGSTNVHLICLQPVTPAEGDAVPFIRHGDETPLWQSMLPDPTTQAAPSTLSRDQNTRSLSMQYGFSASQLGEVVNVIRESRFVKQNAGKTMEFKFLRGSNKTMLGPNLDSKNILINLAWAFVSDFEKATVFYEFEEIMQGFSARPHWGKAHHIPSLDYIRLAYPEWDSFNEIRRLYDPNNVFALQNQWM